MNKRNGSHKTPKENSADVLLWYLNQAEASKLEKEEGPIGLAIQTLKTLLLDKSAIATEPERFSTLAMTGVVRSRITHELEAVYLPEAAVHIRKIIESAIAQRPLNISEEAEKLRLAQEELKKAQDALAIEQEKLRLAQEELKKDQVETSQALDLYLQEANRMGDYCKKLDEVLEPLGGIEPLKSFASSVYKINMSSGDAKVLAKAAENNQSAEFSDGLLFQEISSLIQQLRRQDAKTSEDFSNEVKVRRAPRKKSPQGINLQNGLSWHQLFKIAEESKHLEDVARKIINIRHDAQA